MKKLPHVELPSLIDHRPHERAERDRIINSLRKQQGLPVESKPEAKKLEAK